MGTLYYERLLATQRGLHDLEPVLAEAEQKPHLCKIRPITICETPIFISNAFCLST